MRQTTLRLLIILGAVASIAFAAGNTTRLIPRGTASLRTVQSNGDTSGNEIRQGPAVDAHFARKANGSISSARLPAAHVPTPAASPIVPGAGFTGFNGISHLDQRLAGGGNQFSIEPPDQALAVGNGFVLESVNLAVAAYLTDGTPIGIASLNDFFGLLPAIQRTNPPVYGPFLSDPRAYYDAPTGRWFLTVLEIDTDPATGNLLGHSSILIAVTQSSSPLGLWSLYALDITNDTGTPDHAGCPCFGDQPLIGADANGFYITTNEFPIFVAGFNGAQIYATSKIGLENGTPGPVAEFGSLPLAEGIAYSVQPATTPPGAAFESANGGTEYFVSALDFFGTLDNRIAVWALTNTSSLATAAPSVHLQTVILGSEIYGQPPSMQQEAGPLPLAGLLQTKGNPLGVVSNEHLELIEANDDRMQQVVFADGALWTSLNTVVQPPNGPVRVGAAWFIATPTWSGGNLGAAMVNQGYIVANQANVAFPSIGVNSSGKAAIVFTLVGPNYYPSAAFATLDKAKGAGAIQVAAPGAAPEDGFTGYAAFGGRVARWGDYTTAIADSAGSIWFGVEYIPGGPRSLLANWGTFLGRVQ